ncbi:MAG: glycosyltransferase [Pseudomonadota bacterium]
MTKFAISVPVGAWHPFLPACLASLKHQKGHLGVALMDASDDPRVRALGEAHDDWLEHRYHGPDAGQSDAILNGWDAIDSDWLGWLNADDILMPYALERVIDAQECAPELDVLYGHSSILDDDGAMIGYHFNVEPPSDNLLKSGIISQPSCFFSREAYARAGGLDKSKHYTMDWDLWLRMYCSDAQFGFVDEVLSMVLWGADTKTASFTGARRQELRTLIEQYAPAEEQDATFRAFAIHTLVDRVKPNGLRNGITRYLRKSGPTLFGVRADGQIESKATLTLAHFDQAHKTGVDLHFAQRARALQVSSNLAVTDSRDGKTVRVQFKSPLVAGDVCAIHLDTAGGGPVSFKRAVWIN